VQPASRKRKEKEKGHRGRNVMNWEHMPASRHCVGRLEPFFRGGPRPKKKNINPKPRQPTQRGGKKVGSHHRARRTSGRGKISGRLTNRSNHSTIDKRGKTLQEVKILGEEEMEQSTPSPSGRKRYFSEATSVLITNHTRTNNKKF